MKDRDVITVIETSAVPGGRGGEGTWLVALADVSRHDTRTDTQRPKVSRLDVFVGNMSGGGLAVAQISWSCREASNASESRRVVAESGNLSRCDFVQQIVSADF